MNTVRRWKIGAALAAATLLVASCGGGGDTGAGAEGSDSGGKVELTVWAAREEYLPPDRFEQFMKDNPDITVKFDVQDGDDILQQLQRMRAANQPLPDIIQDDTFVLSAYKEADLIQPIGDLLKQWQEQDRESYDEQWPIAFEEAKIDDANYGVAPTFNQDVFYYNIPAFQKANVALPFKSWDDVLAGMKAVKAADPNMIPLSLQAKAGEGVTAMKGMMSNVGVPFEGATPDLKSPAGTYVIDWFKQATDADLVPTDAIAWGQSEARGAFVAKKTALLIDGLNGAPDYLDAPDFTFDTDWAMVPTPTTSGSGNLNGATVVSSRSWAVTTGTKHLEDAGLVLRYLSSKEMLFATLEAGIVRMPRNSTVLDSPEMAEFLPFLTDDLKKSFADAEPGPAAANAGEVEGVLEQLLGEIVQGTDASAEELADKYQQQLDALSS